MIVRTVVFLALSVAVAPHVFCAETPSLETVLKLHETTLKRLQHCRVTTQERWIVSRADGTPEQILSTRRCDLRFDGPRANMLVFEANFPPGTAPADAAEQGTANEFNYVRNGQVLEIYYPHEEYGVRPDRPKGVNGRLSPEAMDEFFCFNAIGHAAIAFGMSTFPAPLSLAQLLRTSNNGPVVRDDGRFRVDGTGRDGTRHSVWFDPAASYLITGLRFEQSGSTLSDNRYKYNRRVLESRFGFDEKAVVASVVVESQRVTTVPWQDTHVFTGLEVVKTVTASEGAKAIERTTHTLTDWDLEPDYSEASAFTPLLPIPEGERVLVRDEVGLEYAYIKGKIELVVRPDTVDPLEKVRIPRSTPPKTQWVWGLVAVILAVTWWRIRAQPH